MGGDFFCKTATSGREKPLSGARPVVRLVD
jgi:hypothetical protein